METPSTVAEGTEDRLAELFGRRHWWVEDHMLSKTADIERLFGSQAALMDALREYATCDVQFQEGAAVGQVWWRYPKSALIH